ncbi:hypothetical protein [Phocaeicola plebeius]|uniref:hypothetical protein n=1 Tax=Phocaeicola plebeius TaxID=310297 RepID=UPI0011C0E04C
MKKKPASELRIMASEFIHRKLSGAPFVSVNYSEDGATAFCVWPDGVREYLYVDYADLMPQSQHERAMAYIRGVR